MDEHCRGVGLSGMATVGRGGGGCPVTLCTSIMFQEWMVKKFHPTMPP